MYWGVNKLAILIVSSSMAATAGVATNSPKSNTRASCLTSHSLLGQVAMLINNDKLTLHHVCRLQDTVAFDTL